jgi:methylenetetrahydrofolate dehydrogenase (NADP+)/methenyltetrahydrofolate cyclohydrolase
MHQGREIGAALCDPAHAAIMLVLDTGTMTARILDGRKIAGEVLDRVAAGVRARTDAQRAAPGLAVVLVGADSASAIYVKNKRKACKQVGFRSFDYDLPAATSESELFALVDRLNADAAVHGILVQLPLPPHINANALIDHIDPRKDVDGFSAINLGHLALRRFGLRPCTPKGVMTLLGHTDRPVRGQHAVVVGVSNHVGRPLVLELLIAGCTTTCCHKFTQDLERYVRQADIVIAAVGKPAIVKGDWIKPGAVVIDVGINRMDDGRLVGDVEFGAAAERASWITPVLGGVGPMTVATLMENTLEAAQAIDAG